MPSGCTHVEKEGWLCTEAHQARGLAFLTHEFLCTESLQRFENGIVGERGVLTTNRLHELEKLS